MEQFPCPRERTAASALLLLSTLDSSSPPKSSLRIFDFEEEKSTEEVSKSWSCLRSLAMSDSKSSCSSIFSDVSSEVIPARTTRIFGAEPCRREMKLKVVRKSRSKIQHMTSSGSWEFSSGKNEVKKSSGSSMSTEASCLSSGCSAVSNGRSHSSGTIKERFGMVRENLRRISIGSNHIRRRADGIMRLLSKGDYSEVIIRQVLGDSPDTSKALRMLLKLDEVKRSGTGGRQDPYIYTVLKNIYICRKYHFGIM
ncbi:hypothetical protein UlMin_044934 [Ulmus minor]